MKTAQPLATSLAGVRCVVLGAGGFLGASLCRALKEEGAFVKGFGRSARADGFLEPDIAYSVGNAAEVEDLARALKDQEVVFHLVSASLPESSNRNPGADLAGNLAANLRLLETCRERGVRKVVFASSGGTVYGVARTEPIPESAPTDPISAYGITKLATEKYLRLFQHLHGLDFQVLRISNPYGPRQSPFRRQGAVATLLERLIRGQPIEIWGDGEVVRDFIHVNDVSRAFIAAAAYAGLEKVMNVGSARGTSVNQLIADLESVLGQTAVAKLYRTGRPVDVPRNVLDISLITRETSWRPRIAWIEGLEDTARWMRAFLAEAR